MSAPSPGRTVGVDPLVLLLFRQVMEQQRQESLERRTSATGESPQACSPHPLGGSPTEAVTGRIGPSVKSYIGLNVCQSHSMRVGDPETGESGRFSLWCWMLRGDRDRGLTSTQHCSLTYGPVSPVTHSYLPQSPEAKGHSQSHLRDQRLLAPRVVQGAEKGHRSKGYSLSHQRPSSPWRPTIRAGQWQLSSRGVRHCGSSQASKCWGYGDQPREWPEQGQAHPKGMEEAA